MTLNIDDIRIIDTDTHVTEPPDLWTSRLPQKYAAIAPRVELDESTGLDRWRVGAEWLTPVAYYSLAGWPEYPPSHPPRLADADAGAWDPAERLRRMTEYGIYAQVLYPNIIGFDTYVFMAQEDSEFSLACVRAYNDFLTDFASEDPERLVPITMLPFWDLEASVRRDQKVRRAGTSGSSLREPVRERWTSVLRRSVLEPHSASRIRLSNVDQLPCLLLVEEQPRSGGAGQADIGDQADDRLRPIEPRRPGGVRTAGSDVGAEQPQRDPSSTHERSLREVPDVAVRLRRERLRLRPVPPRGHRLALGQLRAHVTRSPNGCCPVSTSGARSTARSGLSAERLSSFREYADNFMFETDYPHPTSISPGPASVVDIPKRHAAELVAGLSDDVVRKVLHDNAARLYRLDEFAV